MPAERAGQRRYYVKLFKRTRQGSRQAVLTLNRGTLFRDFRLVDDLVHHSLKDGRWDRAVVDCLRFDEQGRAEVEGTITWTRPKRRREGNHG
ncbi:MAG TPA: hypothetical protein VFS08_06250 [Gemmatimonadaceae bacterium]|nr:hypothetical protein [Gemmatimonadaceae bacterium]